MKNETKNNFLLDEIWQKPTSVELGVKCKTDGWLNGHYGLVCPKMSNNIVFCLTKKWPQVCLFITCFQSKMIELIENGGQYINWTKYDKLTIVWGLESLRKMCR